MAMAPSSSRMASWTLWRGGEVGAGVEEGEGGGGVGGGRRLGALEPLHRFVFAAELDQVRADVVVRVAERRVHRDGAVALRDGVLVAALVGERPAEEGVRFGARVYRDRAAVGFNRRVDPAGHLLLVAALEVLARLLRPPVLGHVPPARRLRLPCGRWAGPRARSAACRLPQ